VLARAQYLELLRAAAERQGLPDSLLLAVAWVESRGVLTALNIAGASHYPATWEQGETLLARHADSAVLGVGVMQVEAPQWGPRFGLSAASLYHPHVNIPVSARILRRCVDAQEGDLWAGVACYHSPTTWRQQRYVQRVWQAYTLLRRRGLLGASGHCAEDTDSLGPFAATCGLPRRRPVRTRSPAAANGIIPVRPVAATYGPSARLPQCTHQQPGQSHAGVTQSLLFVGPEQEGMEHWLAASGAVGLCVGCDLSDVVALQQQLGVTRVALATPEVIQHFGVTCVPTLVQPFSTMGGAP
jgi:hypothetical protein